jgi:hypothetical protein
VLVCRAASTLTLATQSPDSYCGLTLKYTLFGRIGHVDKMQLDGVKLSWTCRNETVFRPVQSPPPSSGLLYKGTDYGKAPQLACSLLSTAAIASSQLLCATAGGQRLTTKSNAPVHSAGSVKPTWDMGAWGDLVSKRPPRLRLSRFACSVPVDPFLRMDHLYLILARRADHLTYQVITVL